MIFVLTLLKTLSLQRQENNFKKFSLQEQNTGEKAEKN